MDSNTLNPLELDIVGYLEAHYGIEADAITRESSLDDLGVDSLGLLGIAEIIENKYGISLEDERLAGVRTLQDMQALVELKRAERSRRP